MTLAEPGQQRTSVAHRVAEAEASLAKWGPDSDEFEALAGYAFPSLVARLREAESLLAETAGKVGSFGPIMFESERELVARLSEFLKGRLSP